MVSCARNAEATDVETPAWVDDVTWTRLGKKLDPDTMHGNLLQASLFLTVFELLKNSVTLAPTAIELPKTEAGKLVMTQFEKDAVERIGRSLDGSIRPRGSV